MSDDLINCVKVEVLVKCGVTNIPSRPGDYTQYFVLEALYNDSEVFGCAAPQLQSIAKWLYIGGVYW